MRAGRERSCVRWMVCFALTVAGAAYGREAPDTDAPANPPSLLVIAPDALAEAMAPLVEHKNRTGMPARLVTIESLDRASGTDDPARVKRAIAAAHEEHGARWVLLVGDASLFPVRFRQVLQVADDAHLDCTYNPSDLYYANLYRGHRPGDDASDPGAITSAREFDDWDLDGDGAFNAQHWAMDACRWNPDQVDGCPDVALGRLPVHTPEEASTYVAKAIDFEMHAAPEANQRILCVADASYSGATAMCDDLIARGLAQGFEPDVVVERFVFPQGRRIAPPARWTAGTFAALDDAITRAGWVVYLGHAQARAWGICDEYRLYSAAHVAAMTNVPGRAVVFTIGCDSGRFMPWAPSERYVATDGATHAFSYCSEWRRWEDDVDGRVVSPRLVVPRPSDRDLPENRNRTFACAWLCSPGGGVIYAGQTLTCENDKGRDLVAEVLSAHTGEGRVFGDVWLEGQRRYWLKNRESDDVFRNPRIYLGIMTLFGDPSLRLPGWDARPR
jgi:hypothetical protein